MGATEELKEMMIELLEQLEDEFNCNHTREIDGKEMVEIFTRDKEKKEITEFVHKTI